MSLLEATSPRRGGSRRTLISCPSTSRSVLASTTGTTSKPGHRPRGRGPDTRAGRDAGDQDLPLPRPRSASPSPVAGKAPRLLLVRNTSPVLRVQLAHRSGPARRAASGAWAVASGIRAARRATVRVHQHHGKTPGRRPARAADRRGRPTGPPCPPSGAPTASSKVLLQVDHDERGGGIDGPQHQVCSAGATELPRQSDAPVDMADSTARWRTRWRDRHGTARRCLRGRNPAGRARDVQPTVLIFSALIVRMMRV
jgi:hypothetical protein